MKTRILLQCLNIISLILVFLVGTAVANPVPILYPTRNHIVTTVLIIIIFSVAVYIEYRIIYNSELNIDSRDEKVFFIILKINLITIPIVQILGYVVLIYYFRFFWYYILGIEVLVIIVEWLLLRVAVRKKYDRILQSRFALMIVIKANLASFLVGLIPYLV